MKINKINIEVSRLANKQYYLREYMYSFAKEHNLQGEFGRDFITLSDMSEGLCKVLDDKKIKYRRFI